MIQINVLTPELRKKSYKHAWKKLNRKHHNAYMYERKHSGENRPPKRRAFLTVTQRAKNLAKSTRRWRAQHPEYVAYHDARQRCTNPNLKSFKDYGGRGIKFLFTSFTQFFAELGPRPKGRSLDRINNDGNYESGNVRWATPSEQTKNRRKQKSAAAAA